MSLLERVFNYCEQIISGEIKAGQKHKWAVKRFIKDFNLAQEESCFFYFDENELEDFYWFAREFKHVEGIISGEPIELVDFQLFIAANIFCFKKKSNGARKIRKVYIQIGRKNAKSQFLAIVSAYVTFFGDEKHRAFIAGWTRDQSSEVYDAILTGIRSSDLLEEKWNQAYGKITIFKNSSVIIPLSKEARKTGDGKNPSVGIVDEYHAHETSEIYDVLASGMVARREPLMFIITTAGFDLNKPCFKEYEYVSKILDPDQPQENDEYFAIICELDKDEEGNLLDDIKDESNWIKANPIVATYDEGLTAIRSELKVALDQPEKMRNFLTKNMNVWIDSKPNGYMKMSKWKTAIIKPKDVLQYPVFLGLDLSSTTDLTSIGKVFQLPERKFIIQQHSFMPEDKLNERMKTDNVRFDLWRDQGYITTTPGSVVDYSYVEQHILDMRDEGYNIIEIDYDKWNATHLVQILENHGFTMVEIPQFLRHLSSATKELRSGAYRKEVNHFDDPLLHWALSNAVTKQDAQENIMLDKEKSTERIDPAAAVINAFSRAMAGEQTQDLSAHFLNNWRM
ncbi:MULTISPECIES: terminase TerL endonuclease subunit [unclassified Oceanobacillus]|uniref:terminase large subunit n=1 Tax=unclassified Oceanobacillus TaxID=2630292 RepID=UPI001BEC3163|nr:MULTISPECIES: terminase TerL endonuclease subunit [unclassified Oceanobacillus]MBT2600955.1 terminase large subunit [Oceanobacillus sp. ISL-74]MBT2653594.1 terminase large subunit [Oceanobacillus sp. ISL-73]